MVLNEELFLWIMDSAVEEENSNSFIIRVYFVILV